jgi:hypothetical protein
MQMCIGRTGFQVKTAFPVGEKMGHGAFRFVQSGYCCMKILADEFFLINKALHGKA